MSTKEKIRLEITMMMEATLDFAQVACPENNYKALRSKILRVSNNCIRNVEKLIDEEKQI